MTMATEGHGRRRRNCGDMAGDDDGDGRAGGGDAGDHGGDGDDVDDDSNVILQW